MQRATTPSSIADQPGRFDAGYLTGQLLIAMPAMQDSRFQKSVLYMCAHSAQGAMGLVVNKLMDTLTLPELLKHLEVEAEITLPPSRVRFGGPVETSRGFVLHSSDYREDGTVVVAPEFALTATLDVLRALGRGEGPKRTILALGYASWAPGQLDAELQNNVWLSAPADEELVFDRDINTMWSRAIGTIGIDLNMLSSDAGHA